MLVIPVKERESIDRAVKRFKRKFDKTGKMKELRNRKTFVKKSVARRTQIQKAQRVEAYLRNLES